MASLGWESKEDAVTFNPESSKEAFPFHFAVVSGVSSLLFAQKAAETADAVTLLQQQSALRCLRTLCKDHHVEPQSQSLNADTIAQCAIASCALVALVSLLDVSFHAESLCAGVDKAGFRKEVGDFIKYLIARGECREAFYDDPNDAAAQAAAVTAQAEAREAGSDAGT